MSTFRLQPIWHPSYGRGRLVVLLYLLSLTGSPAMVTGEVLIERVPGR